MKLKQFLLVFLIAVTSVSTAQNTSEKVLFTINEKPYYADEFKRVYNKNIELVQDESQRALDQYLKLYVSYKLKINKAEQLGLQNSPNYLSELNSYRTQLAKNYLTDVKVTNELVAEAYERSLKEINASHILFKVDENATPSDTLKAYNKAIEVRKQIVAGADFGAMAVQFSDDPSAKENEGKLGYFSALRMVYPFETGAYKTAQGAVSDPIRTRFGYHLIKIINVRDNPGAVSVSHIMLLKSDDQEKNENNKTRINELYQKLQQGEGFEALAKQFSEDKSTALNGGKMNTFSSGQLSATAFEEVAFALTKDAPLSQPFETNFGWHIVQLNEKFPVKSFEEMKSELENKVSRDERARLIQSSVIDRLKNKYQITSDTKVYNAIEKAFNTDFYNGLWTSATVKTPFSETLLTINDKKLTGRDFLNFIQKGQESAITVEPLSKMIAVMYAQFLDAELMAYYNENLETEFPEFGHLMSEFRDGILLFDLMEKEIWEKAKTDTLGLQAFYSKNKEQYQWNKRYDIAVISSTKEAAIKKARKLLLKGNSTAMVKEALNREEEIAVIEREGVLEEGSSFLPKITKDKTGVTAISKEGDYFFVSRINKILPATQKTFEECEGKVISDYQQYLEENWVSDLKSEFSVNVNQEVFEQIKAEIKS